MGRHSNNDSDTEQANSDGTTDDRSLDIWWSQTNASSAFLVYMCNSFYVIFVVCVCVIKYFQETVKIHCKSNISIKNKLNHVKFWIGFVAALNFLAIIFSLRVSRSYQTSVQKSLLDHIPFPSIWLIELIRVNGV